MTKQCPGCRASIDEAAVVCPLCGSLQPTGAAWQNGASLRNSAPTAGETEGRTYPSSTAKGLSIALAVFCFLFAASLLSLLSLLFAGAAMMEELGLAEKYAELLSVVTGGYGPLLLLLLAACAAFYVVSGVLLLVKKSWKISFAITVCSAVWFVAGMISSASAGIPMTLVFGILATVWLRKDPVRDI